MTKPKIIYGNMNIFLYLKIQCTQLRQQQLTSFVFGLGVFGLVDVTGTGVAGCVGFGCFDGSEILKEFSFSRPFELNCIDNGAWFC